MYMTMCICTLYVSTMPRVWSRKPEWCVINTIHSSVYHEWVGHPLLGQLLGRNLPAVHTCKSNHPPTHPSSPLNDMLSLFICKCFRLDFITCSYASSNKWSRRMLNFNLEPCENPRRVIMILKFCNFVEKVNFFL